MLKPLLYSNGGPIITVQVENEYGSFGCDHQYMGTMRDIIRSFLGPDVLLFTVDGASESNLRCGSVDGVLATVDFGTSVEPKDAFQTQRRHDPDAPLVNSEFYPGWLDHWSERHNTIATDLFVRRLDQILAAYANVNIYVFHGGTSFGFKAGSNGDENNYQVCPTSYDYDAPISEAGDLTDKYFAIRKKILEYLPDPGIPVPKTASKASYGRVDMRCFLMDIFEFVDRFSTDPKTHSRPQTFEAMSQASGFLMYETTVPVQPSDPAVLQVNGLKDRAIVYVNQQMQGIVSREVHSTSLPVQARKGDQLHLLTENQGRLCFGNVIDEAKGVTGDVKLGPVTLSDWTTYNVPLERDDVIKKLRSSSCTQPRATSTSQPASFFMGTFAVPAYEHEDTFLRLSGWRKGVVWVNGRNIGRYWPIVGPQQTLYVPKPWLKRMPESNDLLILELESAPCFNAKADKEDQCFVEFVTQHIVNASVPYA